MNVYVEIIHFIPIKEFCRSFLYQSVYFAPYIEASVNTFVHLTFETQQVPTELATTKWFKFNKNDFKVCACPSSLPFLDLE